MTRKHFIAMAKEISLIADMQTRKDIARCFASVARAVNSNFDYGKFYAACGL